MIGFFDRHPRQALGYWRRATVAIAGCGGLGSNCAIALTRAGIGELIIADFDSVEVHNLNRQQFFADQIGQPKALMLKNNLGRISPYTLVQAEVAELNPKNIMPLFGRADILVEAFDKPENKAMLINSWLEQCSKPVIGASGLAGYGNSGSILTKRFGQLYIIGDGVSGVSEENPPVAPKVAMVAAMQADKVLELLTPCSL